MDTIAIKKFMSSVLYKTGVTSLLLGKHRKSFILSYHHVLPEDDEMISFLQPGMYVTTKTFEQHIQYLTEHYKIIPLDQLNDLNEENTCIITFDDGWADNYYYAYPILKKYDIPATIFLTTNMVGAYNWPWPDKISYYVNKINTFKLNDLLCFLIKDVFPAESEALLNIPKILSSDNKKFLSEIIISLIKKLSDDKLSILIQEVEEFIGPMGEIITDQAPWLTWDKIIEMSEHNIYFGPHTHNHVILTNVTTEKAENEIISSIQTLSSYFKSRPTIFSYPNGNYNDNIISILRDHGIRIAVTTRNGTVNQSGSLLTLRRIMIHNDMTSTLPLFICKIKGII